MSSDLWAEFVNPTGSLLENPWAQSPSGDTKGQRIYEPRPEQTTLTPHFDHDGIRKSAHGRTTQSIITRPVSCKEANLTLGTAPGFESDNIKTTASAHEQRSFLDPVIECQNGSGSLSMQIPNDDTTATSEEFGMFVGPEDSPREHEEDQNPKFSNTSTEELPTRDVISNVKVTNLAQAGKMRSSNKPGHCIGLDMLGSSTNDRTLAPSIPEIDVKAGALPRGTVGLTPPRESALEVSYRADEWDDFFSDSQSSPDIGSGKLRAIKSHHDSISTLDMHSRVLSAQSTSNGSNSRPPQSQLRLVSFKRPFNIPPPSILVSYSTSLIQNLPNQVEAVARRSLDNELSLKEIETALTSYISPLRVTARIIAGRHLRWRRDSILSSSMTIGLAQAGGKSGMKLTGIDKTEGRREEGEVVECVRVWKQLKGKVRAALAKASSQISGCPLALPEISESIAIVIAQVKGPKSQLSACALCGLKREERVAKVDVDVWDNLGEWWSDGWGHTECRVYWEQYQTSTQPP